ncbi:hypothetical protein SARC_09385 [Sphaeroforma arctica JP610]|uniref:Uncharacterized protein n=1 Tax=Sphaeroforma arctica JP610 TaxID=667725 RepID=A0A0L0FN70_9EUKA|nr:hypothetical protein SARC_09385 [Sphaeroforma arctica JP610]KNC78179.1 hypothetical protein SARC_09385 [Sphaeroforma arctica JP610]|eukprot:XP_014152081.1 hypothetical protein SARC_09385 [Sphaeroforma arctica JP610]
MNPNKIHPQVGLLFAPSPGKRQKSYSSDRSDTEYVTTTSSPNKKRLKLENRAENRANGVSDRKKDAVREYLYAEPCTHPDEIDGWEIPGRAPGVISALKLHAAALEFQFQHLCSDDNVLRTKAIRDIIDLVSRSISMDKHKLSVLGKVLYIKYHTRGDAKKGNYGVKEWNKWIAHAWKDTPAQ